MDKYYYAKLYFGNDIRTNLAGSSDPGIITATANKLLSSDMILSYELLWSSKSYVDKLESRLASILLDAWEYRYGDSNN